MTKVQLPKVEEETRTELNIIKAQRKCKSLDETLKYLISLEGKNKTLKQIIKMKDDLEGFESQYEMTGKELE
jgi:macrodomain Ter protein organizer (MatP/YcbG family)